MGTGTLLRYLIGDREAILAIAGNRHALWIGLLFVLSAGFAREYDGEDLLHEPWHLLLPVGASLASSFALFTLAYGVAAAKGAPWRAFFVNYCSFLGLFWMTAPLAWLYAIPYERYLSPADAMRMNLLSLGVVSAWRVALMVRVLMVILNYSLPQAACLVFMFADGIALLLLRFLPFPLIVVMGGLRLSEAERIQHGIACLVFEFGGCSLPFWLLGCLISLAGSRPSWQVTVLNPAIGKGIGVAALGSVLIWAFILPWTQPEQSRKRLVEKAVARSHFADALEELSRHTLADYPPGWDPPPRRLDFQSRRNSLLEMLEEIVRSEPAPWVREFYFEKAANLFGPLERLDPLIIEQAGLRFSQSREGQLVVEEFKAQGHVELANALKKVMEYYRKAKDKAP
jgi:hypothetical protein